MKDTRLDQSSKRLGSTDIAEVEEVSGADQSHDPSSSADRGRPRAGARSLRAFASVAIF